MQYRMAFRLRLVMVSNKCLLRIKLNRSDIVLREATPFLFPFPYV